MQSFHRHALGIWIHEPRRECSSQSRSQQVGVIELAEKHHVGVADPQRVSRAFQDVGYPPVVHGASVRVTGSYFVAGLQYLTLRIWYLGIDGDVYVGVWKTNANCIED